MPICFCATPTIFWPEMGSLGTPTDHERTGAPALPMLSWWLGHAPSFQIAAGGTLLTCKSAVFGGLTLVLVAVAGALHAKSELLRSPLVVGVLVVPILVFNEAFLYHASSGMDPMLSFAANSVLLCALALVARTPTMKRALLRAFSAYGAFLVRPDNALYMLLIPTLYLLLIVRCGQRITIGGKRNRYIASTRGRR